MVILHTPFLKRRFVITSFVFDPRKWACALSVFVESGGWNCTLETDPKPNLPWHGMCFAAEGYEGRVSEALMEANVVAPTQLPLRPGSKAKAKAKPMVRQMVHRDEVPAASFFTTDAGAMTDASKRLAPDGGFTAADIPDDVAYEMFELQGAGRWLFCDRGASPFSIQGMAHHSPLTPLVAWQRLEYTDVDERIPPPQRDWIPPEHGEQRLKLPSMEIVMR